jgi:hypothetical protein
MPATGNSLQIPAIKTSDEGHLMSSVIHPSSSPQPAVPDGSGENHGTTAGQSPRHAEPRREGPVLWLHTAGAGLFLLAAAAAAVSFTAQYRLVYSARRLAIAAGLEAAIPDAAALVFACLGVALALHGRRALRARALNAASAGASVFMNVIAAAPGWRDLAVWAMPPAAYALASDTLIGVVRTSVLARHQNPGKLAGEVTLLAIAGGLTLWMLRLSLAPASTLTGFRRWVLEECPVAPGRRAARPGPVLPAGTASPRPAAPPRRQATPRAVTKTARFLALVAEQHGPLTGIPLRSVGQIAAQVAPQAALHSGSARAALRRAVLAAQDGGQ